MKKILFLILIGLIIVCGCADVKMCYCEYEVYQNGIMINRETEGCYSHISYISGGIYYKLISVECNQKEQ